LTAVRKVPVFEGGAPGPRRSTVHVLHRWTTSP